MKERRFTYVLIVLLALLPVATVHGQGGDPGDSDGDGIPDDWDACPDAAGLGENMGCPEGVAPPDADGDSVPDLYDRCPDEAGALLDTGHMDCPDHDSDGISDLDDVCPEGAGDPMLRGCMAVNQVSLPPGRPVLSTSNAGEIVLLGQFVTDVSQIAVADNGTLAVKSYSDGIVLYDLTRDLLEVNGVLEAQWGPMAISGDGSVLVDALHNLDTYAPAVTVWNPSEGISEHYVEVPDDINFVQVVINPEGSLFATTQGIEFYEPPFDEYRTRVWNTATGEEVAMFSHAVGISQLAFISDKEWLAVGTMEGIYLWHLPTQENVAVLGDVIPSFAGHALTYDAGSGLLAVGQGNGVSVWDTNTFEEVYVVELLTSTEWDTTLAVAFSPDGSLLAVGGGPFVDGPLPEGMNNQVFVLETATGTPLTAIENLPSVPFSVAFSPDGTLLMIASNPTMQFWGIAP